MQLDLRLPLTPWLVSITPPSWRYLEEDGDGHLFIGFSRADFRYLLELAWEREVRAELYDPEWPSPYWEAIEEYRAELEEANI